MKTNALSVANYFIELAAKDRHPLHLLGLMKRVYIAHGFALALLEHGLLDPRFDRVEAWEYGPVIPSVYHSFKQYRKGEITDFTVTVYQSPSGELEFDTPKLTDRKEQMVVEMVWKRYYDYKDSQLVTLTHREGTPWAACYKEGENNEIPDGLTGLFYSKLVKIVIDGKEG